MVDAALRLNENYDFETLEEDVLRPSIFCQNKEILTHLLPGKLYYVKIRISIDQISKAAANEDKQLVITEFKMNKKTCKVNPDHLSKIISKF